MPTRSARTRLLEILVGLAQRRPFGVLSVLALLVVLGIVLGSQVEITTSRFEVVDRDDPYQARLLGFQERFGQPDAPILLVRAKSTAARRRIVDDLVSELEAQPEFSGRVLGRMGPRDVAELLFLHEPEVLERLREAVPEHREPARFIEGGLPAYLDSLDSSLQAALDGDEAGTGGDPSRLADLGGLARTLDAELQGRERAELASLVAYSKGEPPAGLDAEGYLVGRQGTHHLVVLFPAFEGTEVSDYAPVVARIRQVRDGVLERHRETSGAEVLVTGLPVLTTDEHEEIGRALWQTTLATGAGIFGLLLLAFRSLRQTIYVLAPLAPAMALSLGMVWIVYGHLNPLSASFFAILLGLGIDFSIHLTARYHEHIHSGSERRTAVQRAMLSAGPGVLTGAITSATAFLTVLTADFTAFGELGVNAAIGLGLMFVVTMLVLPILLTRSRARAYTPPPIPGMSLLPRALRRGPKRVLAIAMVASLAGLGSIGVLQFNTRYFDFLPRSLESSQALQLLEHDGAMSPMFAFSTAENLEDARDEAAKLRALPSVAEVHSVSDLLPPLDPPRRKALASGLQGFDSDPDFAALAGVDASARSLAERCRSIADALDEVAFAFDQSGDAEAAKHAATAHEAGRDFTALAKTLDALPEDGRAVLGELHARLSDILSRAWTTARNVDARGAYALEDVPTIFRVRHAAKDGTEAVALFIFPTESVWEDEYARQFIAEVESVDSEAAGHAFSVEIHSQMIVDDFVRAAAIAAGLVMLIMFIDFRRPGDALLAMVPVAMGCAWMLGIMALFELRFDAANIVVLPMIFGLGIDAGVHTVHRCRQSASQHGVARLEDLVEGTGSAVTLASLTTMVGFLGLLVADYGGTASLGTTMVLGIACCLLASVIVLPVVLIVLGRVR